jgi:hypothetical protein
MTRLPVATSLVLRRAALPDAVTTSPVARRRRTSVPEVARDHVPSVSAPAMASYRREISRSETTLTHLRTVALSASGPSNAARARSTARALEPEAARLVWRRASAQREADSLSRAAATRAREEGVERGSNPATRPAHERPAMEPAPATPQPPQSVVLSGAVVDRLAEDVISRIERRMRIDRERRGL